MNRNHPPEPIGNIVEAVLARAGLLSICREWQVVHSWNRIVGEKIADVTSCDRVERGVLYVKTRHAAWRQELSYLKHQIIETIAKSTRCSTIRDIVFF